MFLKNIPELRERIRTYLDDTVLSDKLSPEVIAARYIVLNKSANLWRPLLTIATARDYGVNDLDKVIPAASGIEMVHAASLIEDDIADESPFRRGQPSCHVEFRETLAHLAQMYLVQRTNQILVNKNLNPHLSDEQRFSILNIAFNTGVDMISGQTRDVMQIGLNTPEEIIRMYEQKSGALIGLALACGGIIGNAGYENVETLRKLGVAMGVSYQIVDDALDSFAQPLETGKPGGQDVVKKTLLNIVGLDAVRELKASNDAKIDSYLASLRVRPECLIDMVNHLCQRHGKYL